MFKTISNLKYINKYLLAIILLLTIILLIIIVFYLNEKNTSVQEFLENIQQKLNINKNFYSKIINSRCNVIYENNVIIVNDFLRKDYFEIIKNNFNNKKFESRDFLVRKASGINFQKLH